MTYPDDVLDRFWSKTTTDHDLWFEGTRCIIWTASAANRNGYGRFWDGEKFWVAHRFAYVLEHDEIPDDFEVDHRCVRPLCVNQLHLDAVTHCENRRRAERRRVYQLTCSHGHLWTRDNWQQRNNGATRACGQCNRDNAAKQRIIPHRPLSTLSPTCRRNHPRTSRNTRFDKNGVVVCRDCQHERKQEWIERQTSSRP